MALIWIVRRLLIVRVALYTAPPPRFLLCHRGRRPTGRLYRGIGNQSLCVICTRIPHKPRANSTSLPSHTERRHEGQVNEDLRSQLTSISSQVRISHHTKWRTQSVFRGSFWTNLRSRPPPRFDSIGSCLSGYPPLDGFIRAHP